MNDEGLEKTPNELIFIGHFNDFDRHLLMERLKTLDAVCHSNSADIRTVLKDIVPTYHPAGLEKPAEKDKAPQPEQKPIPAGAV